MEIPRLLCLWILGASFVVQCMTASCDTILKSYNTLSYSSPNCGTHTSHNGEIDKNCRFDIVDEAPATATSVLTTLKSHGYSLCFGCDGDIKGHCPNVAICVKGSKCFKRSHGGGYVFGCCDTKCGACSGQCEGDFCNGDAFLQQKVQQLLPTTTSTTTTTTTTMATTTANNWSDWNPWSGCIASGCQGDGVQVRSRHCLLTTGKCTGEATDSKLCVAAPCTTAPPATTPSYWSDWSQWSICVAIACDGRGFRARTRTCSLGVNKCTGSDTQNANCLASPCTTAPVTTAAATAGPCVDDDDAITNTCAFWVTYRVCEPGTASFQNIGSVYCRKTCGLCT